MQAILVPRTPPRNREAFLYAPRAGAPRRGAAGAGAPAGLQSRSGRVTHGWVGSTPTPLREPKSRAMYHAELATDRPSRVLTARRPRSSPSPAVGASASGVRGRPRGLAHGQSANG